MTVTQKTHERGPRRDALHVAFVLDESGSMRRLAAVAGGFDDFLDELRADRGDTYFSLTLFDTELWQVHLATPLEHVPSLARTGYRPRGGIALLDAIARFRRDPTGRSSSSARVTTPPRTPGTSPS